MRMSFLVFSFILLFSCYLNTNVSAMDNDTTENIQIIIDNQKYIVELEDNPTTNEFVNLLPQEYNMSDLNNNEKYVNLNTSLISNPTVTGQINAGDIMLYQDNCIVLFYDDFNTSYQYTKIGHINDFKNPGKGDITVKFIKS